jgi:hypothetical protein
LRDHERLDALERSDLPVDVEHLRLQERRAIRRDDGLRYQAIPNRIRPVIWLPL